MDFQEKSRRSGPRDNRPGARSVTDDADDDADDFRRKAEARKSARHSHLAQHHHGHDGHHRHSNGTSGRDSSRSRAEEEQEAKRRAGHHSGSHRSSRPPSSSIGAHRMSASDRAKREEDRLRHSSHTDDTMNHHSSLLNSTMAIGAHSSRTSDSRARRKEERHSNSHGTNNKNTGSHEDSLPIHGAHFSTADRARRKEERLRHSSQSRPSTTNSTQGETQPETGPLSSSVKAVAVEDDENEQRLHAIRNEMQTASDERFHALEAQIESMTKKEGGATNTPAQENKKKSFWRRNRYCVLITFAVIIAGGIAAVYFLYPTADDDSSSVDPTLNPTQAGPTQTDPPSTDPPTVDNSTSTDDECAAIAQGKIFALPDNMMVFYEKLEISMDISITPTGVIEFLESRMQSTLAPILTNCGSNLTTTAPPFGEEYNILNAIFKLSQDEDKLCLEESVKPCVRVVGQIDLFLEEIVDSTSLANELKQYLQGLQLISILGLEESVSAVEVVGVSPSYPIITTPPDPLFPPATFVPSYPDDSLYTPNSEEDCAAIALGQQVSYQQFMTPRAFHVRMDASLARQVSNLTEVVLPVESALQRILAPRLADCNIATRRRLQSLQIEPNILGNALFRADFLPDEPCDSSASAPCIRILARLTVYLKDEQSTLALVGRITALFGGVVDLVGLLGLSDPIEKIEFVGATAAASAPFPTIPPTPSSEFDYSWAFPSGPTLYLRLNRNDPAANGQHTITFRLSVPRVSWVSLGMSLDGSMVQSEVVIAKPEEGTIMKYRLGSKSALGIMEMESQTLIDARLEQAEGGNTSVLTYTKIVNETGEIPVHLDGTLNTFVAAYGSSNTFGYHAAHDSIMATTAFAMSAIPEDLD